MDVQRCLLLSLNAFLLVEALNSTDSCNILSNGTTAECANVTSLPADLPHSVTKLMITDSPKLKSIGHIPEQFTYLALERTGLDEIVNNSIGFSFLQTFSMKECSTIKSLNLGKPQGDESPLTALEISECSQLHAVVGLNEYVSLRTARISLTSITKISNELRGLSQLKDLDLSKNHLLSNIHESAFQNLAALVELNIADCNLPTLYPTYFEYAYGKSLAAVNATGNPFQCLKMCDFSKWSRQNPGFYKIADIGDCFIVSSSGTVNYSVHELTDLEAGCPYTPAGLIIGLMFASIIFAIVLSYIVVKAFEIDCCLGGGRNSYPREDDDIWRIDVPTLSDPAETST